MPRRLCILQWKSTRTQSASASPVICRTKSSRLEPIQSRCTKNVVSNTELDLDLTNWEWNESLDFPISTQLAIFIEAIQMDSLRYRNRHWSRTKLQSSPLCTERDLPHPVPVDYDSGLSAIDLYCSASLGRWYGTTIPPTKRSAACF